MTIPFTSRLKHTLRQLMCSIVRKIIVNQTWFREDIVRYLSDAYWLESYTSVIRPACDKPHANALLRTQFKPEVLPPSIRQCFEEANSAILAYGQEGEDIILRHLLPQPTGFFVDIGAHHPVRFSNTWALYQRGWRGINIDATPGSMVPFRTLRPEDINIEALVSDGKEPVMFYSFDEPALNTLDAHLAQTYIDSNWSLKECIELIPKSLGALLDTHVPPETHIDVMSLDVEEHELNVLQTNNWDVYKPSVIIVELLGTSIQDISMHPVVEYLHGHGYILLSKLYRSVFFVRGQ